MHNFYSNARKTKNMAGFIDEGADLGEEPDRHRMRRPAFIEEEHEEDVDEIERKVKERYARSHHMEYAEDATDVEQQALLPSVKDPKLWMVKCAVSLLSHFSRIHVIYKYLFSIL
jgi:Spt5 transcription elongation factor, acidic N-terminal